MKVFKKIAAIFCATTLVGCACALSACGKDSTGVISGNYKEATAQEVTDATKGIQAENLLGDMAAKDWKFGLSLAAYVDFQLEVPNVVKTSSTVDVGYKFSMTKAETTSLFEIPFDMKGSGSFKATSKATAGGQSQSEKSEVAIYNDNANVYFAMDELNGKLGLEDFVDMIEDVIDGIGDNMPGTGLPDAEIPDLGDFEISDLAELGFTTYLDTTNGTKIKVSASEKSFTTLLGLAGYTAEQVSFTSTTLDFYIAVDKDGVFSGVGLNFNIGLNIKTTATATTVFKLKGGFAVKAFNGTVKLPDNLDSYTDMSQSIGSIIGGVIG